MSVVTVQLGQCGNQVGQEFFNVLCSDSSNSKDKHYRDCSHERFFREGQSKDIRARAVLIDMEPKVISQTIAKAAKSDKWRYGETSHFCQKQGCGNNWANGFSVHGPKHEEVVRDLIRKEVEQCDRLTGILTMMSLAGGTGSGMGTYITQCLRDTYPHTSILNHVTWPYNTGEVIVQNYNSILTLSHLYQFSDAILVHENDAVHKICAQLMNIKHISFNDVNKVIAHHLGSTLQPVYSAASSSYRRNAIDDFMGSLVNHPEYKLLSVRNIPQMSSTSLAYSVFHWPSLLKHLRQMLIANARMEEGIDWAVRARPVSASDKGRTPRELPGFNRSLANLLILRGKDMSSAEIGGFKDPALYVPWLPVESAFSCWSSPVAFGGYEKSATLVSNSQSLLPPLNSMVAKAWNMFASRAYIHQYMKFGVSEEDFLDSFTVLEQVISSYSQL